MVCFPKSGHIYVQHLDAEGLTAIVECMYICIGTHFCTKLHVCTCTYVHTHIRIQYCENIPFCVAVRVLQELVVFSFEAGGWIE